MGDIRVYISRWNALADRLLFDGCLSYQDQTDLAAYRALIELAAQMGDQHAVLDPIKLVQVERAVARMPDVPSVATASVSRWN